MYYFEKNTNTGEENRQMLGRTHFFIGTAAALAVLQPQTVPALVAGAGAAGIGSMICDIDAGTSQAHREADKIITATTAIAVLTIFAEYKLNLGIYRRLTSNSSILRLLAGTAAFLLICAYGKSQPHRSFMHSLVAMAVLTACVDIIYPDASAYFAIGFLSHLALDFLNRKPEKLFWPWKKGFCLGICSARGLVNRALLGCGMISLCVILLLSAPAGRLLAKIMRAIYG